jgi:hypothetical protein
MELNSIEDIYASNDRSRARLLEVLADVKAEEAEARPEGEKWSIKEIAEHLSMVEFGAGRICAKLLEAAKKDGNSSDGSFSLPEEFGQKSAAIATMKVEAPERVRPTGEVSVEESLQRLEAGREVIRMMRGDIASHDLSGHKFPHPFFGDLTAAEWLVVLGGHEARHTKQIERVLAALRQ